MTMERLVEGRHIPLGRFPTAANHLPFIPDVDGRDDSGSGKPAKRQPPSHGNA